jgi:hypothetical protein
MGGTIAYHMGTNDSAFESELHAGTQFSLQGVLAVLHRFSLLQGVGRTCKDLCTEGTALDGTVAGLKRRGEHPDEERLASMDAATQGGKARIKRLCLCFALHCIAPHCFPFLCLALLCIALHCFALLSIASSFIVFCVCFYTL